MSSWNYRIITSNYVWHLGQRITGQNDGRRFGLGIFEISNLEPDCHLHKIAVQPPATCYLFLGLQFPLNCLSSEEVAL